MYEGYEITLTKLADYTWCPNKPIFSLMNADKTSRIRGEIIENTHEETYPSVIIAKRSKPLSGLNYFETVFYIEDYLYKQLYGNYDNNFTLYEDTFFKVKRYFERNNE